MRSKLLVGLLGSMLAVAAIPLWAHHSFAAEYDRDKPVELHGKLLELEWVNPHAWIHMEVSNESGATELWNCELGSPNLLMRNGWRRDAIKPGEVIIVSGFAAKDGSNLANAKEVRFENGDRVFDAGSSGSPGAPGTGTSK